MDLIQERCDKMTDLLNKRELERRLDIEKTRNSKNLGVADNEKIDYFERTFAEKRLDIENALNDSHNLNKSDLPNHFNNISKNMLILQKYVAASNIFLRSYDIKKCHQRLQELTNRAKELEDTLLPKKKFGFKAKPKPTKTQLEVCTNGHSKDEVDIVKKTSGINFEENFCGFQNEAGKKLLLEKSESFKKDVMLRKLENCIVRIPGSPSTLHLSQLRNCVVLSGPVSTSIFAENCTNSKLVIACQQLRLHSSQNIEIYLHVTSRAIMEDCTEIFIAPYNLKYESIEQDFVNSGLHMNTNNWTAVDDFNWLNTEKQSPNWGVLEETLRIKNWDNFSLPGS